MKKKNVSKKTPSTKTTMKVIHHLYACYEDGSGDTHLFFDGTEIIHSLDASDSPFNTHEFEPLFSHLGVSIVTLEKVTRAHKESMRALDENLVPG